MLTICARRSFLKLIPRKILHDSLANSAIRSLKTNANPNDIGRDDNTALGSFLTRRISASKRIVRVALLGNLTITTAKFAIWMSTGSSAMLSEAIHSLVDSGNQALLLIGLTGADHVPDKSHQYGYGKSVYFWSLVSALGTFWFGAGISMWNSICDLIHPGIEVHSIGWETWSVLGLSFAVDGYVLSTTVQSLRETKPPGISFLQHGKGNGTREQMK